MRGFIAASMAALFVAQRWRRRRRRPAVRSGSPSRQTRPSASIHEEATISTVMPFMSIYNNLVVFDPKSKQNAPDHTCRPRDRMGVERGWHQAPFSCATA